MTVSIWWLVPTVVVSVWLGFLLYSMFTVSKQSDEEAQAKHREHVGHVSHWQFDPDETSRILREGVPAPPPPPKKVEQTEWRYSVSYAYMASPLSTGLGQFEVVCTKPITQFSDVEGLRQATRDTLENQRLKADTIAILNWIELKG